MKNVKAAAWIAIQKMKKILQENQENEERIIEKYKIMKEILKKCDTEKLQNIANRKWRTTKKIYNKTTHREI